MASLLVGEGLAPKDPPACPNSRLFPLILISALQDPWILALLLKCSCGLRNCSEDSAPATYGLYAVLVHLDTMNITSSGHYICFLRLADNTWVKCDDGTVTPVRFSVAGKQAPQRLVPGPLFDDTLCSTHFPEAPSASALRRSRRARHLAKTRTSCSTSAIPPDLRRAWRPLTPPRVGATLQPPSRC